MKHFPTIVGVAGVARSGKDSFYTHLARVVDLDIERAAFADELKKDVYIFLRDKVSISPFTTDDKEKEIIRPILVAYGRMMRNISNGLYWINKMEKCIKKTRAASTCITDVRYPNEVAFIKRKGGIVIHISRLLPDGTMAQPANEEEAEQDPLLINDSDYKLTWNTFKDNNDDYTVFIQKFLNNSNLARFV